MADTAKSERTKAKSQFTRKRNTLLRSIERNQGVKVVEDNYEKLVAAWDMLEGKHDDYVSELTTDAESEEAEAYLTGLQEKYEDAQDRKIEYVKDVTEAEDKVREDKGRKEAVDSVLKRRDLARAVFETSYKSALYALEAESIPTFALENLLKQIEDAFLECKKSNETLLELLSRELAQPEVKWISTIQTQYNGIIEKIAGHITIDTKPKEIKQEPTAGATSSLKLEKIKMPRFDGEIREYPQFKRDFHKQVLPQLKHDDVAYVLRSCLDKEPASLVKSIDDDIEEMWRRLDEKYGDPAKIADVIIDGIRKFRPMRAGEDKRFIEFVSLVEDGYRDLKRLGLEAEMTTTSSVSIIEQALSWHMRRKWAEMIGCRTSIIDRSNKFPSLLEFLQNQRGAIEYDSASLRAGDNQSHKGFTHHMDGKERTEEPKPKCLIHGNGNHWTADCNAYKAKTVEERRELLKQKGACWSCLKSGHLKRDCRKKKDCGTNGCKMKHHPSIHDETPATSGSANVCNTNDMCLLQVQKIRTKNGKLNVMWDNGASLCFITNEKAKKEKLQGTKVDLSIVKIGAQSDKITTFKYKLPLIDQQGNTVEFEVYGIDKITSNIQPINIDGILHLFKNVTKEEITRPSGTIDVLIGYEYAGYHPEKEQNAGHLLLLKNRFGRCLGGTHPSIRERKVKHDLYQVHVARGTIEDFYTIENLGVQCSPRCGGCKCGKCSLGSKDYSIKEEKELELIERNLIFDSEDQRWIAKYPWIKDPDNLPDNRKVAFAKLVSTEKRLRKNAEHAKVYDDQIKDMVERNVARELSEEELNSYNGPIHYISHHEVLKPDSKSTPVRIVFNSSANYMGHVLNEYWAKGPDLLNSLLGILVRFRENKIAFIGDIRKMYHTVKTTELEHHTHRFLWRNMNEKKSPDTYVIQRVSFGDRPSGTIATVALRKTADMAKKEYPEAANIVQNNTYMDDIIESTNDMSTAKKHTQDIETIIDKGGFKVKGWIYSGDHNTQEKVELNQSKTANEKILGIQWNQANDLLCYEAKLYFLKASKRKSDVQNLKPIEEESQIPKQITKRKILSQVNSIFDPLGLAGPLTVKAKILMRNLWQTDAKLNWDDPIPEGNKQNWITFFKDLMDMDKVKFKRCMKPKDAIGNPTLVIFSDGSNQAYAACAYVRWKKMDGTFESNLVLSKNRLAPLKQISIDRIELCGAILNKRLKKFIEKECRYVFDKCYHLVDSQITHAMIQKDSYGFNTFAATRIGEIQEGTNVNDWYWIERQYNIADWLTRGKKPNEIGLGSIWQEGPQFLKEPEDVWPISRDYLTPQLPERIKASHHATKMDNDSLAGRIDITKYSSYDKLIRVTARILKISQQNPKPSFKNLTKELTPDDIEKAEWYWIKDAQKKMKTDIETGRFNRLCPYIREDGIYVVSNRAERWMEFSYNKKEVILLPYEHKLSRLYAEKIHNRGHYGVLATASKIRSKYWIVKLLKIVKSIKVKCVTCRKLDKKTSEQIMGRLPEDRLKPAPPWNSTAIDLFGPITIRDEVKKRTTSKAYGVLFNCLGTRAIYVDVAPDYSTEKFLMVLRRFVAIRGYPAKLYSDNGSQLVAANKELKRMTKSWDWNQLKEFGVIEGFQWKFTPADAPWQNGISEALIKSVKRAISASIGESVLTYSELQTVLFEVANLVNERPIGRHPTSPNDGSYLCPNDLLLGRATSRIPSGPYEETTNPRKRFYFIQGIINNFWKRWVRNYFPSLLIRQKWHTAHRNVRVGDVVLIQDSNAVRGQWRLGKISRVFPGTDSKVRNVEVEYKNAPPGEPPTKYKGSKYVRVERPIHRLVVILPKEEETA